MDAKNTMASIMELLPNTPNYRIGTDGMEIFCDTEQLAENIADFIDAIYSGPVSTTGYYDPEATQLWYEPDYHTGWYYVDIV